MKRTCSLRRALLAILLACTFILVSEPGRSQNGNDSRAVPEEAEALRARIAELEIQNATIYKELAAIRERLDRNATASNQNRGVQVASASPMVPASLPAGPAMPIAMQQAAPAPTPSPAPPAIVLTEGNKSELTFYGFVRADAIFDDSRANAFQTPTFIRSEAPGAENRSNFTFHPRLTRLGMNYRIPAALESLGGARLTGKFEMDFQNGGRESRAIPRYRHAYMQIAWGSQSLLLGQTWDIISSLFPTVNADTLMWNAGNLGDRRVQLRYTYEPPRGFNLRAGLGLTGAVDGQDVDGNGILDGEASTMPNFQGRIGYTTPNGKVLLGAWSHFGRLHTDTSYAGKNDFDSYSYGGDYEFRFTPRVNLRGELWAGSNLSDFRGGVGQFFISATGKDIGSRGGWVELGLRAGRYSFSTGFTMDDPKDGHVASSGAILNRSWYATNQFRLAPPVTVGIDYLYWQTRFKGLNDGTDNRFNLYMIYGF